MKHSFTFSSINIPVANGLAEYKGHELYKKYYFTKPERFYWERILSRFEEANFVHGCVLLEFWINLLGRGLGGWGPVQGLSPYCGQPHTTENITFVTPFAGSTEWSVCEQKKTPEICIYKLNRLTSFDSSGCGLEVQWNHETEQHTGSQYHLVPRGVHVHVLQIRHGNAWETRQKSVMTTPDKTLTFTQIHPLNCRHSSFSWLIQSWQCRQCWYQWLFEAAKKLTPVGLSLMITSQIVFKSRFWLHCPFHFFNFWFRTKF